MANPFTISGSRCTVVGDPALRNEILTHTGSSEEASAILRSLERFGGDSSIRYFEMTPKTARREYRGPRAMAWTVHAVR